MSRCGGVGGGEEEEGKDEMEKYWETGRAVVCGEKSKAADAFNRETSCL